MVSAAYSTTSAGSVASTGSGSRATAPIDKPVRIGDLLLARGIITQQQLTEALTHQKAQGKGRLLGEVVVELKIATEEQVLEVLAEAYDVPFARVNPRVVDPKIIEMLPRQFIESQCVLPMFHVAGKLTVAVHEPSNVFLIEEIERLSGCPVQIVAATAKDIRATTQVHLPASNVFVIDELVEDLEPQDLSIVEQELTDVTSLEQGAKDSPVIKLVNYLIYAAVQEHASDIHIEVGERLMRVRLRVDGVLFEKMKPPFQMQPAVVSRIKIMAGMDISERRVPQDGAITVMMDKRPIDLRVSTMPGKFGEKVVIRIIDNRHVPTGLEHLGFSPRMLAQYRSVVQSPNGIVLVTGPTGSGKSSTLYAALRELSDETVNLCTVEDPVEYNLAGVNQFQVNDKAGFTFAGALRSLLRQDPDVIMVGEIRDLETARIATQAALTGHLVLSTLHTNDAPSAVTRLFNIGVEPYLVAASLRGVLAQRLLRKICKHCKEPVEMTPTLTTTLSRLAEGGKAPEAIFHGVGCPKCRGTGYSGRIGIFELLVPTDETADAISRGGTLQELRRIAKGQGYISLQNDGLEKVAAGSTTIEELISAIAIA